MCFFSFSFAALNALGYIKMNYAVDDPLSLIITPAAIDQYNVLFHFLLQLRRVSSALTEIWATFNSSRKVVRRRDGSMHFMQLFRLEFVFVVSQPSVPLSYHAEIYLISDSIYSQYAYLCMFLCVHSFFACSTCADRKCITTSRSFSSLLSLKCWPLAGSALKRHLRERCPVLIICNNCMRAFWKPSRAGMRPSAVLHEHIPPKSCSVVREVVCLFSHA